MSIVGTSRSRVECYTRYGNDGVLSVAPKSTWHIAVHRADGAFATALRGSSVACARARDGIFLEILFKSFQTETPSVHVRRRE